MAPQITPEEKQRRIKLGTAFAEKHKLGAVKWNGKVKYLTIQGTHTAQIGIVKQIAGNMELLKAQGWTGVPGRVRFIWYACILRARTPYSVCTSLQPRNTNSGALQVYDDLACPRMPRIPRTLCMYILWIVYGCRMTKMEAIEVMQAKMSHRCTACMGSNPPVTCLDSNQPNVSCYTTGLSTGSQAGQAEED